LTIDIIAIIITVSYYTYFVKGSFDFIPTNCINIFRRRRVT